MRSLSSRTGLQARENEEIAAEVILEASRVATKSRASLRGSMRVAGLGQTDDDSAAGER